MMTRQDESGRSGRAPQEPAGSRFCISISAERELLEIWPASDPARLRFHGLEKYLASNYHKVGSIPTSKRTFEILSSKLEP